MKTLLLILAFLILSTSFQFVSAQSSNDCLGLALAELCQGYGKHTNEAIVFLKKSSSGNAKAILERLESPWSKRFRYKFDYNDPVFNGFYFYLKKASEKYSFLKIVLKEFDALNPNKALCLQKHKFQVNYYF